MLKSTLQFEVLINFLLALGTISKIIINIELNKLKDIKYLNPVTLNVKYLYIYLINKKGLIPLCEKISPMEEV